MELCHYIALGIEDDSVNLFLDAIERVPDHRPADQVHFRDQIDETADLLGKVDFGQGHALNG